MKESYNDDQMDFLQYNQPFQKSKPDNNINNPDLNKSSDFTILLHFPQSKSFSFKIPNTWTTKKLISFILSTFKSEFNNSIPTFIHKGNMLQPFSESLLKNYFDPLKLNHIIVTLKDKEKEKMENGQSPDQNNKNILETIFSKSNKEVFKTQEFCDMEKYVMEDYNNIFKEDSFNNFPLMSPAYNKRREQIKYDPQTEKFAQFEPVPLEDFPFRNYFQLKIIFKCIISFFALGIYIKGFNFILFLCVLVIYYWYCINNIIEDFYKKKFQEIGLNEDEYKRIGEEIKDIGRKFGSFGKDEKDEYEEVEEESENDDENENENGNKDENNKEDIIYEEKSDENVSNNNINKEASNNINLEFEEEMKDINFKDEKNDILKEPLKDLEFKEEEKKDEIKKDNTQTLTNNNIINENKDNININNNRIKNMNKKNKKKEQRREEPEQETPLQIAYQIIYLFFISFIPPWCDEFEAQNPMPPNNPRRANNDNNANNNNEENQNNNININNDINNNNLFNNINNKINDNNIGHQSSNSPQQEEDSNNNKMTSSKVVNMSEDSNRDNKMYNLLKKDNQNLNEHEYVFSEHGGIDSLSMNSELFKQKKEKEKEKENKENIEKENEKQIYEEEKENIIEEEKHLKNE